MRFGLGLVVNSVLVTGVLSTVNSTDKTIVPYDETYLVNDWCGILMGTERGEVGQMKQELF